MSRRNSPSAIPDLGELSRLAASLFDKRQGERASAKKNRRNRHYERQFIRDTLAHLPQADRVAAGTQGLLASTQDSSFGPEDGFRARPRATVTCPLYDPVIPPAQADRHHLDPQSKGGRRTEFMHRVCHRQVHALLTESELAGQYATVEALLQHPELRAFLAWVKTGPEDFFVRTHKSTRMQRRRR